MPRLTSLPVDNRSPYQQHVERWKSGCGNDICDTASRRCFGRGQLPCDVLLIGEGPGESENVIGRPFVGPAGKLIDRIIKKATSHSMLGAGAITDHDVSNGEPPRISFTNLVLCIPRDEDGGKAAEPLPEEVRACRPRLEEFIKIARPKLVVGVGKLAQDYLEQGLRDSIRLPKGIKVVGIVHPAAILRMPQAQQSLAEQRAIVILRNAVEELV